MVQLQTLLLTEHHCNLFAEQGQRVCGNDMKSAAEIQAEIRAEIAIGEWFRERQLIGLCLSRTDSPPSRQRSRTVLAMTALNPAIEQLRKLAE